MKYFIAVMLVLGFGAVAQARFYPTVQPEMPRPQYQQPAQSFNPAVQSNNLDNWYQSNHPRQQRSQPQYVPVYPNDRATGAFSDFQKRDAATGTGGYNPVMK